MRIRPIEEYVTFMSRTGKADLDKLRKLHNLVVDFRGQFLTNHSLQDLFLNRGYEVKDRPTSFLDIEDSTINRNITRLSISFLDMMIDISTRPRLLVVKTPGLWFPGKKEDLGVKTPEGYSAGKIEYFQTKWLEDGETTQKIRSFKENLESAFDEYNLKLVLYRIEHSRRHFIDSKFKEECELQEKCQEAMYRDGLLMLDDSYYNQGNRFYNTAGNIWKELQSSEFGKEFTLSVEDIRNGLSLHRR